MSSSPETEKLNESSLDSSTNPSHKKHEEESSKNFSSRIFRLILQPFQWLHMLFSELNPTFVIGIFIVYGLSQGFAGSFFKVASEFYWKDVQKVQPSAAQLFQGLYYIPWLIKPLWGLLTDVLPVLGYHRRPYFVLAGVVGMVGAVAVAAGGREISVGVALVCLIGMSAGLAIADVIIDACIARNSREKRSLAPDMQSLCGVCSSAGALVGFSTSGSIIHSLGPQVALGLLAFPATLLIGLAFVIYEVRSTDDSPNMKKQAAKNLGGAVKGMFKTIQIPQVWKPSLFIYLSLALSISTYEGQFYWYTDPKAGPAFSQEQVGMIYAIGAIASVVGVLIYQKTLKDFPFRSILFYAQLLYGLSGMLDIVFILRWNLALGIPDYFFLVLDESISGIVGKIRWMPMIVLSTRLCPTGIEGTFFALLMSIDSLGSLSSKWGGGMVLHFLHVTRNDFKNLWLAVLIMNLLRLSVLSLIFLIPDVDHLEVSIPSDVLSGDIEQHEDDDNVQLVPLKQMHEV